MSARYVLRYTTQTKNGKEHPCYGLMENRRVTGGRMVQRHAVYLGEINGQQAETWRRPSRCLRRDKPRNAMAADPD